MTKHQAVQDSTYFKSSSSSLRIPSGFGLLCDLKKINIFQHFLKMACLSLRSNLLCFFCFFPPVGQHDPPRGRELPAVLPQRSSPEKQRRLHEGELRVRRRGAAPASFRMCIVEVSGTNKENLSGTYLSVKHPESDKTDDDTVGLVGWISGYLGYRISEVMLRWSHQGRASEETCM